MLPDMAEGHVGVLVNNFAVQTEGELPVPSFEVERLPHEARVMVEVTQQELLVRAYMELPGSVCPNLEKLRVQQGGTSGDPHGYKEGSSLLGQLTGLVGIPRGGLPS